MDLYQNLSFLVQSVTSILLFSVLGLSLWPYIRRFYYISKIPGPRAYPLIGNALLFRQSPVQVTKMILTELRNLMPVCKVWLGPHPVVFISNPDDIQKVLTNPNALEKSWIFTKFARLVFGDPILISEGHKWKKNRKLVMTGLSQSILTSFVPHFVHESEILAQQLANEVGKKEPFDIYGYISRATMDSVTGAAMGVNINAQVKDSPFFNALNTGLDLQFKRGYNILQHPDLFYNWTKDSKAAKQCADVLFDVTDKVIAMKRHNRKSKLQKTPTSLALGIRKNPLQKPFLDYLLDLHEAHSMTNEEVRDETNVMISAAYETSAVSICYMLLAIAANPEVQAKVYKEICSMVGPKIRLTNVGDIGSLQYMDMVIKETMRICPTVPYIIREIHEDIQLENCLLPKGSSCVVQIMFVHNDEKIWENPDQFVPERFLPSETQKRHPYAFIPFSAGPRNCVGIRYANMFMKIMLVTLLQEYELHTPLQLNKLEYKFELSLKLVGGHLLTLTKREANNKNSIHSI